MTSADGNETIVSLQDRSLDRLSARCHLAAGVLLTPEQAVFDLPAELEIRAEAEFEVLIAPARAGERDVIERIRPLQVIVRSLAESPEARVALVPLAHRSRYGAARPRVDRDEIERTLNRTGEIWSGMIDLHLADRPLRDFRPVAFLDRLDEIERLQKGSRVSVLLGRTPGDIANCPFRPDTECNSGGFFRSP
jgi:hypothetical protein